MEFLQAFPITIIDEDYEGKGAAGRGMRFEPADGGRRYLVDCVKEGTSK